jgi:zinc protease
MKNARLLLALSVVLAPNAAAARTVARAPYIPGGPAPRLFLPSQSHLGNGLAPAPLRPTLAPALAAPSLAPALAPSAALPASPLAPAPAALLAAPQAGPVNSPQSPLSALSAAAEAPAPQPGAPAESAGAAAARTFDGALSAPNDSAVPAAPAPASGPRLDLPAKTFTLANGLKVVVHSDHSSPVVAVSITYKVGSQHETPGLDGFAHLFEHLMAQGTKSLMPREISRLIESNGGVRNAYTMRTNTTYHSVVPKSALKTVLWAEAERMSTLNVDERALALEQQVVLEEMRLRYVNQAYAKARDAGMAETAFTKWSNQHTTIGEADSIRNARLEDVRAFYKAHYAPNNAVIALAGDVTEAEARELVERFYGPLAPAPATAAPDLSEAPMTGETRRVIDDKFAKAPLLMAGWNAPERGTKDYWALTVLGELLGGGEESPLYQELVKGAKVALEAVPNFPWWTAHYNPGGPDLFGLMMVLKPGASTDQVLGLVDRVLGRLASQGPDAAAVDAAKTRLELQWVSGLEQLIDRAQLLSSYAALVGDPANLSRDFAELMSVSAQDIRDAASRWLVGRGRAVVEARPAPQLQLAEDPATPPVPAQRPRPAGDPKPELDAQRPMPAPRLERFTLSNGLKVVVNRDARLPVVEARLIVPAGRTSERDGEEGLSLAASDLLFNGAAGKDAAAVSAAFSRLGWKVSTDRGLEHLSFSATGLSRNTAAFFRELVSVLTSPAFPADEVELWKENKAEDLKIQRAKPDFMSGERLKAELFGASHPYGKPALTDAQLAAVTRERVAAYARRALSPDGAVLVLTGDADPAQLRAELEAALAGWSAPSGRATAPAIPEQGAARLALVDRPGSKQANLSIASAIELKPGDPDWLAFLVMNQILGGSATSRLFVNLRVDKGYTYGSYSRPQPLSRGTMWTATAEVRNEVAGPALEEMRKEIRRMREEPVSPEQLAAVKRYLAGLFLQKNSSIDYAADSLASYERNGQDAAAELASYIARLEALTPEDIQAAARRYLDPEKMVTVVVGDSAQLAGPLGADRR